MNEIQLRNDVIKKAKLYEWFGDEGIINIQKEYNVGYNRYVDLMVETEKQMILIEIKKELNSYDIGQILTYEIICQQHKKNIKLVLLVNKSIPKELKLFNAIIKKYNIDIMLIVYGNETCKLGQQLSNMGQQTYKLGQNTKDLINKIDEYIVLKYKIGDLINVSELKKEFGFKKQDRKWNDKVRPYLKSAYINENKRLERVQIDNKDKFKIIK